MSSADIVVAAAGVPNLITADMVKEGAAVIDVGISRVPHPDKKGRTVLVGDVDFRGKRRCHIYSDSALIDSRSYHYLHCCVM